MDVRWIQQNYKLMKIITLYKFSSQCWYCVLWSIFFKIKIIRKNVGYQIPCPAEFQFSVILYIKYIVSDIILYRNINYTRSIGNEEKRANVLTLIYLNFFSRVAISFVCSTFLLYCHNKRVRVDRDKDPPLSMNLLG